MTDKHLRRNPKKAKCLGGEAWWYEEPKGICVCAQVSSTQECQVIVSQTFIAWSALRGALARKDKPAPEAGRG